MKVLEATYQEDGHDHITLIENEYYLMGDNRKVSFDSRLYGAEETEDIRYEQSETLTVNFAVKFAIAVFVLCGIIFSFFNCKKYIAMDYAKSDKRI